MSISKDSLINKTLSNKNVEFYKRDGFLIAPGLLSGEEVIELKRESIIIFKGERGQVDGILPQGNDESDEDILKKYVAIHFPHKISQVINRYLYQDQIINILKGIISPNLKCMQSMLFVKAPGKAGQSWHQDEFYIPTRDQSLIGVWIAIDDATIENGCLWINPERPKHIMERVPNYDSEFADVDAVDVSSFPEEAQIPIEVKKGTVVFFHGYTLHSSRRNTTSDCFRTALVNHYMSAESMLPWDQDGKLDPTNDLRDIVLVAGEDPYAWKGIQSINKPFLRPEVLDIKSSS